MRVCLDELLNELLNKGEVAQAHSSHLLLTAPQLEIVCCPPNLRRVDSGRPEPVKTVCRMFAVSRPDFGEGDKFHLLVYVSTALMHFLHSLVIHELE